MNQSSPPLPQPVDKPVVDIPPPLDRRSLNLPNLITAIRLVASFVLFVLIDWGNWWITCAILFVLAASTDFLDGYFARKWNQITQLGRIMDPFVDKIIVCGTFIFLTPHPDSGVCGWVTFIVIAREMFVTGLRSILEKAGTDFSAQFSGKLKMVIQSATVPLCLLSLSTEWQTLLGDNWGIFLLVRKWALIVTVAVTLYSGAEYVVRGFWLLSRPHTPQSTQNAKSS